MFDVLAVRTPTVPPATHTNCYRLGRAVIDPASPWPEEQDRLATWAGKIDSILLTHHHADHVGGVAALVARTGAKVYTHTDARLPFPVDVRLEDGDTFDTGTGTLRCFHTPGHADGHLCFQEVETGDIVAGDLVAGMGTIVLVPPEGHLATYLASLERLLPIAGTLLPAHGPPLPDGVGVLQHYIRHRHARTAQVEAALAGGPRTPQAIAGAVYAGIPGVDLGLATAQVRTHLQWLAERGRARVDTTDHWARETT